MDQYLVPTPKQRAVLLLLPLVAAALLTTTRPLEAQETNATNALGGILGTCSNMVFEGNGNAAPDLFARCSEIVFRGDLDSAIVVSRDEITAQGHHANELAGEQQRNLSLRMSELRRGGGTSVAHLFGSLDTRTHPALAKASMAQQVGGAPVDDQASRVGLFVNGEASFGDRDAQGNDVGFDIDTMGITVGLDYRFSDRFFGGIALGLSETDADLTGTQMFAGNGRGTLDIDGVSVSLYGSLSLSDTWFLEGNLTSGQNDYDTLTEINYDIGNVTATVENGQIVPILLGGTTSVRQQAVGETEGDLLSGRLGIGNEWRSGAWGIQTGVSATYTEVEIDAYDERMLGQGAGSELAIGVDDREIESLIGELELLFSYTNLTNWGAFEPVLALGYKNQFEDDPRVIGTELVSDPNRGNRNSVASPGHPLQDVAGLPPGTYPKDLTVLTEEPEGDWFVAGLGFTAVFRGGNQFFMFWDTYLGHDVLSLNRFSAGFRLEF